MKLKDLIKYAKKNTKTIKLYFVLFLFAILIIFLLGDTAFKIIFIPVGVFLGYYSTMFGKLVPHVAPETMTITSVFSGVLFGWKYGFFFGLIVSLLVYSILGLIKLTTLLNSLVIASGGLVAGLLIGLGIKVSTVFLIALIIRSIVGVLAFWNITSDKMEALAHAILDPTFNIALYMPLFVSIYNIFF